MVKTPPPRECEGTTWARWVFKSAKPFLTSPRCTWAWQKQQTETPHTGGQTSPCCWCFLSPYKVQVHYRGAVPGLFLLADFGLRVSFMLFKNCCYNVFIDTHARTFCPFLQGFFVDGCRLLQSQADKICCFIVVFFICSAIVLRLFCFLCPCFLTLMQQ